MQTRGVEVPFVSFGKVTSEDLFEEREQTAFDFYEARKDRYKVVLDAGANIGVHSLIMAKQGWTVWAFEPDPMHYAELIRNCSGKPIWCIPAALSYEAGEREFVRVLGNTTANHLAGARNYHGETEKIRVDTIDGRCWFQLADFAKVDVEGHEAALLLHIPRHLGCEIMVEIGSKFNAEAIYYYYKRFKPMWRQRGREWEKVKSLDDVPTHYKDGALFIGEM